MAHSDPAQSLFAVTQNGKSTIFRLMRSIVSCANGGATMREAIVVI
jgi:hypothetical protein